MFVSILKHAKKSLRIAKLKKVKSAQLVIIYFLSYSV